MKERKGDSHFSKKQFTNNSQINIFNIHNVYQISDI